MARPQVADGGDGLQIWRVAANILNKKSRTADRGWSSDLGVGWAANNSLICYEPYDRALDQDGFFGTTQAPKNEYEIWHLECYEPS
jgi:hypothetical protein